MRVLATALLIAPVLAPATRLPASEGAGQPVASFTLSDASGAEYSLADYADRQLVVIAFVGAECPLVRLYTPRMIELHERFAERGVALLAIDSNRQDSADDIAAFVEEFELPFPVLRDEGNVIADRLDARRTPEIFVLDSARHVRYRGRIDDQFGVGYQRPEARMHDLANAIESLLAGREVPQARTEAAGCIIGRAPETQPDGAEVTFTEQIAGVLERNCVDCHRAGEIGPFALTEYDEVAGWAETLVEVVDAGLMPPWFAGDEAGTFLNDRRMSDEDADLLRRWVEAGCPLGDEERLRTLEPPAGERTNFHPDLVYPMAAEPFDVPAEGVVDYQYYAIDPGWTEDKWVSRVDAIPGQRSVVHHILVFMQRPEVEYEAIYPGELIGGYVPGRETIAQDERMGFCIPAGAKIIFQMHYTPSGKPVKDMSHVAFTLCDEDEIDYEVTARRAINVMFQIPPGAADYRATASYHFQRDAVLMRMIPHMHVRGKSFRYEALYPNGTRELLLDVPRWDFNWQLEYVLAQPKYMPRGTELRCTATFDNSEANLSNPDPTEWVTFGEQTWDEMLIGFFVAAEPRGGAKGRPLEAIPNLVGVLEEFRPDPDHLLVDRAANITRHSAALLQRAQERRGGTRLALLDEIGHIVSGGIEEAKKQGVIDTENKRIRFDLGFQMLTKTVRVLNELQSEGNMTTTRVEPVEWPLRETP